MFEGYSKFVNENVRLTLLKALAAQHSYRLNDGLLLKELEVFGHNKPREYVREQLRWLEETVGAVKLTEAGTALIAEITDRGLDHVQRRTVLTGVERPSPTRAG
jgi:repressor of nif and glnA expression